MNKIIIIITGEGEPLEIAAKLTLIAHQLRVLTPEELSKERIWNYGPLTIQTEPKKEGGFFG